MRRRAFLAGAAALAVAPRPAQASGAAEAFVAAQGVPGVSWAIRRRDGTMLEGAAGVADLATLEILTPGHRMRIASVSKPLTAAVVLTLAAEGKLRLTDRVLGPDALLGPGFWPEPAAPWADRLRRITVDHLLTHTSGGWPNGLFDPAFWNPSLSRTEMIRATLGGLPLVVDPGRAFGYSNFGYCLLGRVIERVTERSYRDVVADRLLTPAGVTGCELMSRAGLLPGEAAYHTGAVGFHAMDADRMDAFGGWVASPRDLAALFAAMDGTLPDVLPPEVPVRTAEPWRPGAAYGRGLIVSPYHRNRWHDGFLPGTCALAIMVEGGDCIAAMTNGSGAGTPLALEALAWRLYEAEGAP
jgi:CubicO group peptidase (beta-lactamase class C family)